MIYRAKLNGSWSAGLSHNFVVINQVAQNSLKSFWLTLFVLQNVQDVSILFKKAEK